MNCEWDGTHKKVFGIGRENSQFDPIGILYSSLEI